MQRWEYLTVILEDSKGYKPRYENFAEIPNWKKVNRVHYLNEKGREGWELISYLPGGTTTGNSFGQSPTYYIAMFKRPLP